MIWITSAVLMVFWMIALMTTHPLGGLIHLAPLVVMVLVTLKILQGRKGQRWRLLVPRPRIHDTKLFMLHSKMHW